MLHRVFGESTLTLGIRGDFDDTEGMIRRSIDAAERRGLNFSPHVVTM